MSKKKIHKYKFGTFSNKGLGSFPIEVSPSTLQEIRMLVKEGKKEINGKVEHIIERIGDSLKIKGYTLPPNNELVSHFFDKKKIYEWGDDIAEIDTDEFVEFIISFTNDFKHKLDSYKIHSEFPKWRKSEEQKEKLLELLVGSEFLDEYESKKLSSLLKDSFEVKEKVNWQEITTTLLIYLFQNLMVEQFITKVDKSSQYFEDNFTINNKAINNIRQAKTNIKSSKSGKPKNFEKIDSIIRTLHSM